jgi:hypothetical protein
VVSNSSKTLYGGNYNFRNASRSRPQTPLSTGRSRKAYDFSQKPRSARPGRPANIENGLNYCVFKCPTLLHSYQHVQTNTYIDSNNDNIDINKDKIKQEAQDYLANLATKLSSELPAFHQEHIETRSSEHVM